MFICHFKSSVWNQAHTLILSFDTVNYSFIHGCVHCCGLQMSHVSVSSSSLYGRIWSCPSSLLDHQPMFVVVSLVLTFLGVFRLLFPAEYHNTVMCFLHNTYFWVCFLHIVEQSCFLKETGLSNFVRILVIN